MFNFKKKATKDKSTESTDNAEKDKGLTHGFLVSRPNRNFTEFEFSYSVIYIIQHDENGAFGVNIARAHASHLGSTKFQWGQVTQPWLKEKFLMDGGPIATDEAWVLSDNFSILESLDFKNSHIGLSLDLTSIKNADKANDNINLLFGCGHAAWAPGQLEEEVVNNEWIVLPVTEGSIFERPWWIQYIEKVDMHLGIKA